MADVGERGERAAKEVLRAAGIPFPGEILVRPGEDAGAAAAELDTVEDIETIERAIRLMTSAASEMTTETHA